MSAKPDSEGTVDAAREDVAATLHRHGEGGNLTWAEELEQATPGMWGVVDYYREWADEVLDALLSARLREPCPTWVEAGMLPEGGD